MTIQRLAILPLLALLAAPAFADPPDHAPAWGRRDKDERHDRRDDRRDDRQDDREKRRLARHRGYTGAEWVEDYGVASGRCNTDAVMTAVGAATGAVIGNRLASDGNRAVATIVGAIAGGVIGNRLGDAIDDRDRACMGQSLELVPVGRTVVWVNPQTRVGYRLRPVRDLPGGCRAFEYAIDGRTGQPVAMTACRSDAGLWAIRRN